MVKSNINQTLRNYRFLHQQYQISAYLFVIVQQAQSKNMHAEHQVGFVELCAKILQIMRNNFKDYVGTFCQLCAPFRHCITHSWQSTKKRPSKSTPITEGDYSANIRLRVNIHVQENKL